MRSDPGVERPSTGQGPSNCCNRAVNVAFARLPVDDGDAHGAHPIPCGATEPGFAAGSNPLDDVVGAAVMIAVGGEEANQALVDLGFDDDLGSWQSPDPGHKPAGMVASAFDDAADSVASERANGGVDGEATATARPFGVPVDLIAGRSRLGCVSCRGVGMDEVARSRGHRVAVCSGVPDEGEAGVVGHIEPLVSIGYPGVSLLDPSEQGPIAAADRCPQAKRTVDMHPSAPTVGKLAGDVKRIECPGVDISGLQAEDRWSIAGLGELPLKRSEIEASVPVGANRANSIGAESQDAHGTVDGGMLLAGSKHADRRGG